jgi:hypothetical protein
MYPFHTRGRYGLIFREEVDKEINIVLMNSEKDMYTIFENLKQHMLYICTIDQWKKYYQKIDQNIITDLRKIPKQEDNESLIDLHIGLKYADVVLGPTKLGETIVSISELRSVINYKEYNTDARGEMKAFNLNLGN